MAVRDRRQLVGVQLKRQGQHVTIPGIFVDFGNLAENGLTETSCGALENN